jgi:hypothetical protein
MNKRAFIKEKILLFKEYSTKHPDEDLLGLFREWAEANNIEWVIREQIWSKARKIRKRQVKVIQEDSEEWVRLQAVLEIVLEADKKCLDRLLVERKAALNG